LTWSNTDRYQALKNIFIGFMDRGYIVLYCKNQNYKVIKLNISTLDKVRIEKGSKTNSNFVGSNFGLHLF